MYQLDEALDIAQRRKRGQIARANRKKLAIARRIARRKMAPKKIIEKRAMKEARKLVRKRFAGQRGIDYNKLGPTEKMVVDKAISGKVDLIRKIAKRMIPKIQKAEAKRLQSFLKGTRLENLGKKEGNIKEERDIPIKGGVIKMYDRFETEKRNNSKAYKSLKNKACDNEISEEEIGAVYDYGMEVWEEVESNVTREQFAFATVNTYISEEIKKTKNKPFVKQYQSYTGTGYKSMNKHGKLGFWNNPEAAHKHAGIEYKKVNEEVIEEAATPKSEAERLHKHYSHKNFTQHGYEPKIVKAGDKYHVDFKLPHHTDVMHVMSQAAKDYRSKAQSDFRRGNIHRNGKVKSELTDIDRNKHTARFTFSPHKLNEEVEQIDELSDKTKLSYIQKAIGDKDRVPTSQRPGLKRYKSIEDYRKAGDLAGEEKRRKGIEAAYKKLGEELGPDNEIGTDELAKKYKKETPGQENISEIAALKGELEPQAKSAPQVHTSSADKRRVKYRRPDGTMGWRNIRKNQDIVK